MSQVLLASRFNFKYSRCATLECHTLCMFARLPSGAVLIALLLLPAFICWVCLTYAMFITSDWLDIESLPSVSVTDKVSVLRECIYPCPNNYIPM